MTHDTIDIVMQYPVSIRVSLPRPAPPPTRHVRACHGVQDESAAVAFPIAVSDPAGAGRLRRQRQRAGAGSATASGSDRGARSEEHTSELQSLMRISYAVF